DVPNAAMGRTTIDGVAKDGIQLKVKARVTVRTNIKSLVGGATEETIIARVGEGIVNAIGSAQDYKHVLENPDSISKAVLAKGMMISSIILADGNPQIVLVIGAIFVAFWIVGTILKSLGNAAAKQLAQESLRRVRETMERDRQRPPQRIGRPMKLAPSLAIRI